MRLALCTLFILALFGCSGGATNAPLKLETSLFKENAKVAEDNLKKMREASLKYYEKNKAAPEKVDDLAGFGAGPDELKADKYYSELGFTLFRLKFNEKGELIEGKFRATPRVDANAPIVMLDAKTSEFDYKPRDSAEPASNEPSGAGGIEIK